jgi:hypothetical protein
LEREVVWMAEKQAGYFARLRISDSGGGIDAPFLY